MGSFVYYLHLNNGNCLKLDQRIAADKNTEAMKWFKYCFDLLETGQQLEVCLNGRTIKLEKKD